MRSVSVSRCKIGFTVEHAGTLIVLNGESAKSDSPFSTINAGHVPTRFRVALRRNAIRVPCKATVKKKEEGQYQLHQRFRVALQNQIHRSARIRFTVQHDQCRTCSNSEDNKERS
jgi:hypothetical protein